MEIRPTNEEEKDGESAAVGNISRSPAPQRGKRDYPIGKPIQPPPGWQPRVPPPAALAAVRPATAPFRSQLGLVLSAMMLGLLVFVCTMIGWLWSKGPRRAKTEVAAASAKPAAPPPVVKVIPEVKDNDKDKEEPPPPPARRKRKEVKEEEEEDRPAPPKPPDRPKPEPAPPPAEGPTLTYEKDILPIMQRSCVSCHGGKKRGGLDLRTFPALRAGGDSGPGVQPGKPNDSPLLESVLSNRMPPGRARKLTAAEKQLIRDWIATGAKSNTR